LSSNIWLSFDSVFSNFAVVPSDALGLSFTLLDCCLGKANPQNGNLLFFILDAHAIRHFTAELNQKFLSCLPWIFLDDLEIL